MQCYGVHEHHVWFSPQVHFSFIVDSPDFSVVYMVCKVTSIKYQMTLVSAFPFIKADVAFIVA